MTAVATQILNSGASLKIISADGSRNILKHQIHEISIINDTVIKIDIGQGALNNIFIEHSDVSNPLTPNPSALVEAINAMLLGHEFGSATEANQQKEIIELQSIKNSLLFNHPLICDESNPKVIYKGYAAVGSKTSEAVWAIEKISNDKKVYPTLWADGNRNFDKVWDNRKTLNYK